MASLRILADDLTGALDSAARFVSAVGPVPTYWKPPRVLPATAAIDTGTRELSRREARGVLHRLACLLDGADHAFKKLDSLLRGHAAIEIAACVTSFDHCVIAPAFPFQRRATRDGRQALREPDGWRVIGPDLAEELQALGAPVARCRPGDVAPAGISLWDAETDADLAAVVAAGEGLPGRVLWCGSAGLAGAMAGDEPAPAPALPAPILALVGSDHAVSVGQLSAAWAHVHRITRGSPDEAAPLARRLTHANAAVAVVVPPGADRPAATRHVAASLAALLGSLDQPGTLFVSGGETLRAVCDCLGAERLDVDAELAQGIPGSILCGGRWDGLRVLSKSGAFGDAGLLLRLLTPDQDGDPT
ncbi:MAG TPA: four-carbon acid sugar kinase family protein [Acetobacteraceae bacterium]|nr:four-carbon acid sugar kinase family protein [Acetobacteraceae bacterium]